MTASILEQVEEIAAAAEEAIPARLMPDLQPGKYSSDQPEFYRFEHEIWHLGERIRQLLLEKVSLRKDETLQKRFAAISTNRHAKRGRQSFIMLLGFKSCQKHSESIASQIDDPAVCGHVIDTLLKMKADSFVAEVKPFVNHEVAWIRKKARTYCERFERG